MQCLLTKSEYNMYQHNSKLDLISKMSELLN